MRIAIGQLRSSFTFPAPDMARCRIEEVNSLTPEQRWFAEQHGLEATRDALAQIAAGQQMIRVRDQYGNIHGPGSVAHYKRVPGNFGTEFIRTSDVEVVESFPVPAGTRSFFVSPDSTRFAYIVQRAGHAHIEVNGRLYGGKEFHAISGLAFTPNSQDLAFVANRFDKLFVVFSANEYGPFDDIGITSPIVSPDGNHVAYTYRTGRDWFVARDGVKVGGPYRDIVPGGIVFSPDSKRLMYAVMRDNGQSVCVDGIEGPTFPGVLPGSWNFFPDSGSTGYLASLTRSIWSRLSSSGAWKGTAALAVNGEPQRSWPYDESRGTGLFGEVFFSADSKHVAYVVIERGQQFVVVDGQPGKGYQFMAEGYSSEPRAGQMSHMVEFSPDSSHHAYGANDGKKGVVVIDTEVKWRCHKVLRGGALFSNDSKRLAIGVEEPDGSQLIVADGIPQMKFLSIPQIRPSFSPDSEHLAYCALDKGDQTVLVVDTDVHPLPGGIIKGARLVWEDSRHIHTIVLDDLKGRVVRLNR